MAAFVQAWNGGAVVLPFTGTTRVGTQVREHTRLVVERPQVMFKSTVSHRPTIELGLTGTFVPRSGVRWPYEPWKQDGARTFVLLYLRRTNGWWREGEWAIDSMTGPWSMADLLVN